MLFRYFPVLWVILMLPTLFPQCLLGDENGNVSRSQSGGDAVFSHPLDGDAVHPVLPKVQMRLTEVQALRARFQQTKEIQVLSRPLTSHGDFLFWAGRGAIWKLKQPYKSLFVVTPESVRQSDAEGKLAALEASEQPALRGFTEVFLGLLTGNLTALRDQFEIFFVGTESAWKMGLKGRDWRLKMFIEEIVLSGGATVQKVQILEKSGDRTVIEFSDVLTAGIQLSSDEQTLLAG